MAITFRAFFLAASGILLVALYPAARTVALWGAIWLFLVGLDYLLAPKPRNLAITRQLAPTSVRLGGQSQTNLAVFNQSNRKIRVAVRDVWQPTARILPEVTQLTIPPGQRRRTTGELSPVRRGTLTSQKVALRVAGPLYLAYRTQTRQVPGSLLVLPPFRAREHLPSRLARLRELDGLSSVNIRGQGTEFDSLREYVIGDDVRAIDWRASARAQGIVVRTWRPERDRRVVVLIDTGRLSAVRLANETRLDVSIEAALLLAALASHAGDRIDAIAIDTTVRAHIQSNSSRTIMHQLALAFANVEPTLGETDWQLAASTVLHSVRQHSLVVIITALDTAVISGEMRKAVAALALHHTVVVAGAQDDELDQLRKDREKLSDVYIAAAAERSILETNTAITQLSQAGAIVVSADGNRLPPQLADMYLQLKASGKL